MNKFKKITWYDKAEELYLFVSALKEFVEDPEDYNSVEHLIPLGNTDKEKLKRLFILYGILSGDEEDDAYYDNFVKYATYREKSNAAEVLCLAVSDYKTRLLMGFGLSNKNKEKFIKMYDAYKSFLGL